MSLPARKMQRSLFMMNVHVLIVCVGLAVPASVLGLPTTWSEKLATGSHNTGIVGTGDVNGDGTLDVAYARNGAFQWEEGPGYTNEYDIGVGNGRSYGGTCADMNGDGWVDLVASDGAVSSGPGKLWVFLHPGNAHDATQTWTRVEVYSLDVWHQNDLRVADMDGDTRRDIVVRTRADDQRLVMAFQNANFTNWTVRTWATGETANAPEGLAVGDVE